jgi:hypothetical protein
MGPGGTEFIDVDVHVYVHVYESTSYLNPAEHSRIPAMSRSALLRIP